MIYISKETDIYFNLAVENYLIEHKTGSILFLWQNSPSVIIGRYQNPYDECNLDAMKEDNVKLSRRYSGGGAVYHDLGNVCFTIIDDKKKFSIEENFKKVKGALNTLGIEAEISGRNDILVDGLKVSGSAFQYRRDRSCHHGTMLLNSDLRIFDKYLSPSKKKLQSHSVKSVYSRVGNLCITTQAFIDAMKTVFSNDKTELYITKDLLESNKDIQKTYKELKSEKWLMGNSPKFTNQFEITENGQDYKVGVVVEKDIITHVEIYTDSLDNNQTELIKKDLTGRSYSSYISSLELSSS